MNLKTVRDVEKLAQNQSISPLTTHLDYDFVLGTEDEVSRFIRRLALETLQKQGLTGNFCCKCSAGSRRRLNRIKVEV